MVEKFRKSWVLLICQVTLLTDDIVAHPFARERLLVSTLINPPNCNQIFVSLKS